MIETNPQPKDVQLQFRSGWAGCAARLGFHLHPDDALSRLGGWPKVLLLHSARRNANRGRYSFLMADPFIWIESKVGQSPRLQELETHLSTFAESRQSALPPFQGGLAGYLSYDLNQSLESLPAPRLTDFAMPALALGLYDTVIAWDHEAEGIWVISQGFPETEWSARRARSKERIDQFVQQLRRPGPGEGGAVPRRGASGSVQTGINEDNSDCDGADIWRPQSDGSWGDSQVSGAGSDMPVPEGEKATGLPHREVPLCSTFSADQPTLTPHSVPEFPNVPSLKYIAAQISGLTSNVDENQYRQMIGQAIEYIRAGEIYQVNLSQRLLMPAHMDSLSLYRRLCTRNPAPFAGYFDIGCAQILSCSPERFLAVRDRCVETRPIKGTRRRTRFPFVDLAAQAELRRSEKDRAENVMIVDLMRNDLSRVCEDNSIRVRQLLQTEAYESVFHLVSSVEGRLRSGKSVIDLIRAAFPGGSITGAPKIRAMEIIAELEPTARGAYCGSLGYFGFDGSVDLNIMIRTITAMRGYWQIPVGGGIVAQSQIEEEYRETWTKAAGMLQAVSGVVA